MAERKKRGHRNADKPAILVDAADVAFTNHDGENEKGSVENTRKMRHALRKYGYRQIFVADAALRHHVDEPDKLEELEQRGDVLQSPAGSQADYFILAYSEREHLYVISNDTFRDRKDEFPGAHSRRVPFMFIDGDVVIDREQLPTADKRSSKAST